MVQQRRDFGRDLTRQISDLSAARSPGQFLSDEKKSAKSLIYRQVLGDYLEKLASVLTRAWRMQGS